MRIGKFLFIWLMLIIALFAIYVLVFNPTFLEKIGAIDSTAEPMVDLQTPTPSPAKATIAPTTKKSKTTSLSVTCDNCAQVSKVTTTKATPTPTPKPTTKTGTTVSVKYNYTPDYYTLLNGEESYPNELVYAILEKQELGHLKSEVKLPSAYYSSEGKQIRPGVYLVTPEDVKLSNAATITVNFSIRIPTLNNKQFEFLRDKEDYRFVYGLIRGIVGHEEKHFDVLKTYVNKTISILNNPLTEEVEISAQSDNEFQQKINNTLENSVSGRLAAAQKAQDDAQDVIDDPDKGSKITFIFEEEARDDVIPTPIVGQFKGQGTFEFSLPDNQVPRPPKPNIDY